MVRLRRRVQAIDCVAGDLYRGVEPEGLVGAADVVVDRLRDAEDRQLVVGVQADRGAERAMITAFNTATKIRQAIRERTGGGG